MDHLRQRDAELPLAQRMVVLDEADEMLRMGFSGRCGVDSRSCARRTTDRTLSATMPLGYDALLTISHQARQRWIKQKALILPTVQQQYIYVSEKQKLDVLTRLLRPKPSKANRS